MSYPLDQVLLVMPAKDEEEAIGFTITEVQKVIPEVSILVVSDGSTDRTSDVARAAGARVLELPFNLGVGGAMRLGFRYAAENGYPVMVQLDSDGQHNPANVPALVELLDSADVVIGARFAGVGDYAVRGPRKWAMMLLSSIISFSIKTRLTDTTSGFKAHGPKAISIYKDDFPAEYLGDTVEAIIIGHRAGLSLMQVPVVMRERVAGTPSQGPLKSAIYLARAFVALFVGLSRPRRK